MLSSNLEHSLHQALSYARERNHEYGTLEHLLLALIDDEDAVAVLRACSVDIKKLKNNLSDYLDNELGNLVVNREGEPKPTSSFQRVIQRAAIHVQTSGRQEVTGANVLVSMFSERESNAVYYLQEQEMSRFDAVNFISHGISRFRELERRNLRIAQKRLLGKIKKKTKVAMLWMHIVLT